jgi:1-acylglycerone phosphate reductase
MTTSIPKKTVLITGRSLGGIGSALALAFHKHNFTVFTTARSHSKISHLRDLGLTTFALDITDPVSIKMAVEVVKSASGGLDILVNNAGAGTLPSPPSSKERK